MSADTVVFDLTTGESIVVTITSIVLSTIVGIVFGHWSVKLERARRPIRWWVISAIGVILLDVAAVLGLAWFLASN